MIFKKGSKTKSLVSLLVIIAIFFCIDQLKGQSKEDKKEAVFADHWEFVGKAAWLYAPSGTNIYGRDCTISYVTKFKAR